MSFFDPYGQDVLAGDWKAAARKQVPKFEARMGEVVEHESSGFCGAVVGVDSHGVQLEDARGGVRVFPLGFGFLVDGKAVEVVRPVAAATARTRTASGSFAVGEGRAKVAQESRIFVEGRHDAELVWKVWGDDLSHAGVVVEYLEGLDHLDEVVTRFAPTTSRRMGVLADHLIAGTKETRIAARYETPEYADRLLIVGHPFIDIWQAVKPARLGLDAWPDVPRGTDFKVGTVTALGWPAQTRADIANAWQRILAKVSSFNDLEPALLGRVEQLIDFVTA